MAHFLLNPAHDDQQLLAQAIDYYHRTLTETTEGLDYLRSRGVTVGEALDHFRIGYANRTLGLTLPSMDSGLAGIYVVAYSKSASSETAATNTSTAASCSRLPPPMEAVGSWTSTVAKPATIFARGTAS